MGATSSEFKAISSQRVIFFDNLRYLFVIGVIFQHAAMAYFGSDWWPVRADTNMMAGMISGSIGSIADGFLMPSLFFIAGYFAVPTAQKQSIIRFIQGKLKRLGVPWLVCILFICPILPLIYHFTRDGLVLTNDYSRVWFSVMENAVDFSVGLLPAMNEVMKNDLFYQRYMWFVSLLLTFFIIFSLIYRIKKEWFAASDTPRELNSSPAAFTVKIFISVGTINLLGSVFLIVLMFKLAPGITDPDTWFVLGNVIQFRVGRIFMLSTFFVFGILVYKWRWVETGRFPGHLRTWLILFVVVFLGYWTSGGMMLFGPDELKGIFSSTYRVFLYLFAVSALGLTASLVKKYMNQQTPLNKNLSANSYNLYLTHYPFVLGFQLIFLYFPEIPPLIQFVSVCALAFGCAYLTSEFLVKRYPKIVVFLVSVMFFAMMYFIRV